MLALHSMRYVSLFVVLFTGCAYVPPTWDGTYASGGAGGKIETPTSSTTSSGAGGLADTSSSSSSSGMGGSGGVAGAPPVAFCDPSLPELLACFRFNGNTDDESGKGNQVNATAITFVGGMDGEAANFDPGQSSAVRIADADHWDVTSFTIELWYYLRSYPSTRMGLFDSDSRYGFFIYPGGELRCTRGDGVVNMSPVPLNTWTHAACAYSAGTVRLYVDGSPIEEATTIDPDPGTGENAIGANAPSNDTIDGIIDDVRIWNVMRTNQEICLAAGRQGC